MELLVKIKRIKVIGEGSYGLVYLADVPLSGGTKTLAVKTAYNYSSLQKEERIYRTLMDCPQVVRCYGGKLSFEKDMYVFYNLLLEYAPRGTLSDLIKSSGGKLEENQVQEFTRMILEGLRFIHSRGYVHCDLKPSNILVFTSEDDDSDGREEKYNLKISDFGLAKEPYLHLYTDDIAFKEFRGTPDYMSPESFDKGEIEPPLDIWSLGCVVCEMITGKRVWSGHVMEKVMMHLTTRQEMTDSYKVIPDNISDEGKDFLGRCFEIQPLYRWNARMLLDHPFVAANKE